MKKYEPAIGQIDFVFSSLENLQNVENLANDPTSKIPTLELVSPLTLAQYALYNTDKPDEDNGISNNLYLAYEGGFLTQGNKINNKKGSLGVRGNLTVRNNTNFYKTIDLKNNSITFVRQKGIGFVNDVLKSNNFDNEPLTVGDFRNNAFAKGTIMMWSGTYNDLFFNLPNWRLCGQPDSNIGSENGVAIPNLEGFFIIGANYSNNSYQPLDNVGQAFGSAQTLSIYASGGSNGVFISISQMPSHKHDINHTVSGGGVTLRNNGTAIPQIDMIRGSGDAGAIVTTSTNVASDACMSSCPSCGSSGCAVGAAPNCCASGCTSTKGATTWYGSVQSVPLNVNLTSSSDGTVSLSDPPLGGGVTSQNNVGSFLSHENRPPFYVLGYIINVGEGR